MKSAKFLVLPVLCFLCVNLCSAQDMKAKKHDNPVWMYVTFVKFKPGMKTPAVKMVDDYFVKADKNAGIKAPIVYDFNTGEYDYIVAWEMGEEGISTLDYELTPDDAKWFTEMGKITGSMENAEAKMQEFYTYVEKWQTEIARKISQ